MDQDLASLSHLTNAERAAQLNRYPLNAKRPDESIVSSTAEKASAWPVNGWILSGVAVALALVAYPLVARARRSV